MNVPTTETATASSDEVLTPREYTIPIGGLDDSRKRVFHELIPCSSYKYGPETGEPPPSKNSSISVIPTLAMSTILPADSDVFLLENSPRQRKPGQCPHGRQKDRCKDCGGSAICLHGKQKRFCRVCGGSGNQF